MATDANSMALAAKARRSYVEGLLVGMPIVVRSVEQGARNLVSQEGLAEAVLSSRREVADDLERAASIWLGAIVSMLKEALQTGVVSVSRHGDLPGASSRAAALSLVDNETIEGEILSSRLALAMMDRASWEFTDMRSRISMLEGRDELATNDALRPHVLSRIVTTAWRTAGMNLDNWRTLQTVLHDEFSHFAEEAYHETNRWLVSQRVLPEIDLRPFIRRTRNAAFSPVTGFSSLSALAPDSMSAEPLRAEFSDETRLMTREAPLSHGSDHAEAVMNRLNRLIGRQLPEFVRTQEDHSASPTLNAAISEFQEGSARRQAPASVGSNGSSAVPGANGTNNGAHGAAAGPLGTPALLEELNQRKQALKQAASTPVERATIEIVALLFQSILNDERIPASVRVWFARLQMPVLRVAVGEPDFFAANDHPARRLIDRMGACVMGFDPSDGQTADILESEIKRVVQIVEAYPDTGRRVFQTVLTEFEKFLEHYFKNENEASRVGVSLAQQVEQRETLAIQYTIELRKMLNEMPVQEGVRDFLFHVWADVLAMTAVKAGAQSEETKAMKRVAADLIWSASAKVTREERAEVIRRLPPLLKTLREGMKNAGLSSRKQDEHVQRLNNSLAAAFTAKTASIPQDRLEDLMSRLETLESLLPDASEVEIDESVVLDLSGHESSELEVVAEGGSMPTAAMLAWARELQVGSWFMLDYRSRNEAVQLAWQGMRRQLALFVSPQGRGVLFQKHRLASFLQAGLLVPAQEESLTVRATRNALEKLDVDPSRLLS